MNRDCVLCIGTEPYMQELFSFSETSFSIFTRLLQISSYSFKWFAGVVLSRFEDTGYYCSLNANLYYLGMEW